MDPGGCTVHISIISLISGRLPGNLAVPQNALSCLNGLFFTNKNAKLKDKILSPLLSKCTFSLHSFTFIALQYDD